MPLGNSLHSHTILSEPVTAQPVQGTKTGPNDGGKNGGKNGGKKGLLIS